MRWFHTLLVRLRFNQFLTNHSPEDSTRGLRRQVELCSRARGKSRLMTEPVLYCAEPSGSHIFEGLVHLPILEFDRFQRIRIRPWPIPKNSTCGSGELRKWGWFSSSGQTNGGRWEVTATSRCGGTLCLPCSVLHLILLFNMIHEGTDGNRVRFFHAVLLVTGEVCVIVWLIHLF
jgi:hypothetical protein